MFFARFLSFGLGLLFAWAAAAKLLRSQNWSAALAGYRLPGPLHRISVPLVPVAEGATATLFFAGATRVAAAVTVLITASFSWAIARAFRLQGTRLPCGCFGSAKDRDHRLLLARNAAIGLAASNLLLYGRDVPGYPRAPSGDAWVAATLTVVGLASLLWLVASVRSGFRKGAA